MLVSNKTNYNKNKKILDNNNNNNKKKKKKKKKKNKTCQLPNIFNIVCHNCSKSLRKNSSK